MHHPISRRKFLISQPVNLAFEAFSGGLRPHFAFGALSKTDFALAHVFHIANQQNEIVLDQT